MNLHEYQAKKIFADSGIPVAKGLVAYSADEAALAVTKLQGNKWVIKVQVHAGGRGKAGGVKLINDSTEARDFAEAMLNKNLITVQTDANGQPVKCLYIEEGVAIAKEFYLGAVIDRNMQSIVFMASTEGGVEIEKVALETPHLIHHTNVNILLGPQQWQGRNLAYSLGLKNPQVRQFTDLFMRLAKLFIDYDCSLLEVNPLVLTEEGDIVCLDAKINIDSNALFRQPELEELRDFSQENKLEVEAAQYNLSYVALDGDIGCMVNGAGLAMGTMDLVKSYGGSPANFLDVGGGATYEAVSRAFRIILSSKNVKVVFINIFGGIVSCETIAEGIIAVMQDIIIKVPIVVRFEGNSADLGRKKISVAGSNITAINDIQEAAQKAVAIAAEKL